MTTAAGTVARMQWGLPPTEQQPTTPVVTPDAVQTNVFTGLQEGMTQQDRGDGTYDILHNGEVLGTGYKGVMDAYKEIGWNNATSKTAEADGVWTNPLLGAARQFWTDAAGNEVQANFSSPEEWDQSGLTQTQKFEATQFKSKDEVDTALKGLLSQNQNFNGTMGEWEALGQVLNGEAYANSRAFGGLPTNQKEEVVKGRNALFGSAPVFEKTDKGYGLLGYKTDLTPNAQQSFSNGSVDNAKQEQFGTFISHKGENHSWSNSNWRELNNPEEWGKAVVMGKDGSAFIPKEAIESLPGWTNKDSYAHQDIKKGLYQKIWEATSPGHNLFKVDYEDAKGPMELVGNVVGMYFTGYPLGSLTMASDSATAGDGKGATRSLISAAAVYAAGQIGSPNTTPVEGATAAESAIDAGALGGANTGAGGAAMTAGQQAAAMGAVNAAGNAAGTYVTTGDAEQTFKAAIGGAITGAMGAYFSGANTPTLQDTVGWSTGMPKLDSMIMKAGMGAVKSAVSAGVKGDAELGDVFARAAGSVVSSLVGDTVAGATDSKLAGTVAGSVTGGLLNQATRDDPKVQSPAATATPTKPAEAAPTSKYAAGSVARMMWRT